MARVRGIATVAGPIMILAGWLASVIADPAAAVVLVGGVGGFVLLVLGMAATFFPGAPDLPVRTVVPPVRGRWVAVNSPTNKRPSHGTHGQGQTFAIDLVYDPKPGTRPSFGEPPGFRPPERFPAFGQPLYAPADATVLRVRDGNRDHRSRSTWSAYGYMMLEGMVRELAGSRHILGNHIVLDLGDGVYAVLAHLQRGSVGVSAGDRVHAGQHVGRCGNSGNSSEPHVHFQLMDSPKPFSAAGLPLAFPQGVPRTDDPLLA